MSTSRGGLSMKDFKIQNEIGRGGFGMVYLVKGLKAGYKDKYYALKEIPNIYGSKSNEERIRSEIEALSTLNAQNSPDRQKIVTFYCSFVEGDKTYILMEYCQHGSLRKYISKYGALDNHKAADVMSQLIQGIRFIHKCKIAHRDLTTGNVLIYDKREDGNLCVKIADFGLTKTVPTRPAPQTCVGTPGYIATEMMNGEAYNESADVYSLGAILYMMLVGEDPETITKYAEDGRPMFKSSKFERLDTEAKDLIRSLMCKAEKRLRLDEIHSQGFIHRSLAWVQQMRGNYRRSGSADQRCMAGPRKTSVDGAASSDMCLNERYSGGAGVSARHRRALPRDSLLQPSASVPPPSAQLPSPETARARYQRAATSNDSAFGSQEPLLRRSRSRCPHTGVAYGNRCGVCETWVTDKQRYVALPDLPVYQHYKSQPQTVVPRRPSGAENRAPCTARSLPPSVVAASSAKVSSIGSASHMIASNPSESYKWPVPYPHYFARWHANIDSRYARNNDYGRFIVNNGSSTRMTPDVIFEMKSEGVVQLVFRVYWCCEPGKRQVVRVQRPIRAGITVKELTDPDVERDPTTSVDYKSLEELLRTPDANVRTGYQRIFQFFNLARYKLPRRTIRNVLPGIHMDVRYDGTITMELPDNRPLVEIKRNGNAKNLEHLKENEKLAFDIFRAELAAFHEVAAITEAKNSPADTHVKLDALRMITAHTEILRTPNTESKITP